MNFTIAIVAFVVGGIVIYILTALSFAFAFAGESFIGGIWDTILSFLPESIRERIWKWEEKNAKPDPVQAQRESFLKACEERRAMHKANHKKKII